MSWWSELLLLLRKKESSNFITWVLKGSKVEAPVVDHLRTFGADHVHI